jgi:hypothetical protein
MALPACIVTSRRNVLVPLSHDGRRWLSFHNSCGKACGNPPDSGQKDLQLRDKHQIALEMSNFLAD